MRKALMSILISAALLAETCLLSACSSHDELPHTHVWSDATCSTPRICSLCKETDGKPNGHSYALPSDTLPKACTVCGEVEEAHSYVKSEVDPTCTNYGYTLYVCDCGAFYNESFTDPLGHSWQNDQNGLNKSCVRTGCEKTEKLSAVPDDKNLIIGLNDIPIASSDMTEDELRDLIVQFMRLQLTFGYKANMRAISTGKFQYYIKNLYTNANYSNRDPDNVDGVKLTLEHGKYYGGVIYTGNAVGSVYRWAPFYNVDTCVMDYSPIYYSSINFEKRVNVDYGIEGYPIFPNIGSSVFGNSCASSVFWAWARVSNKMLDCWSHSWRTSNGQILLGDLNIIYKSNGKIDYSKTLNHAYSGNDDTEVYKAYALLKKADGLATEGHSSMIYEDPVIVYDKNGNIDPDKSYVLICSNSASWWQTVDGISTGVHYSSPLNDRGDRYFVMCHLPYFVKDLYGVDTDITPEATRTFRELFRGGFLPFSIPELMGMADVEDAYADIGYGEDAINTKAMETLTVTSNYYISDVQFTVVDHNGQILFNGVYADEFDGIKYLKNASLEKALNGNVLYEAPTYVKSALDSLSGNGHYILIRCRVSTGELITVYSGLLAH